MNPELRGYQADSPGPTGLYLDTSGLFARFHPGADRHDEMSAFFDGIASGEFPYRPLVTNTYVVDELATLLLSKATHDIAAWALETLLDSDAISVRYEEERSFAAARDRFLTYDSQELSFTDHYTGADMNERAIDHVLTLDSDFETLGFTVVPRE